MNAYDKQTISMLHRKQSKMQSLIKKAKINLTFEISLYLNHFTSVSLIKQGYYFVMVTLNPKDLHKDQTKITSPNSFFRTETSRVFRIKYNNHTEILGEAFYFTFCTEGHLSELPRNNNKMFLLFQLFRCRSQNAEEAETKLISEYEPVSHFGFEIKSNEQLSFIEYFDIKFEMPYASQLVGTATCLMTNFQLPENSALLRLEKELLEDNKINRVQSYFEIIFRLKKLAKNYRFMSFTVQKTLETIFSGFKASLTIPSFTPKRTLKQLEMSVLTEENLDVSIQQGNQKELSIYGESQIQVPKGFADKLMNCREKKCDEEQFIGYLAFSEHQDKKLEALLDELKSIGKRNKQIMKQAFNLGCHKQKIPNYANLEAIKLEYQNKKSILYSQKTTYFGLSLISAAEQMQNYLKYLAIFKSKQKQNYFTDMNQLFHLNPCKDYDNDSLKFDKCPYVFYSHESYYQGVKAEFSQEDLVCLKEEGKKMPSSEEFRNVFVLAHGYQASCGNMQKIKICLKKIFPRSKILVLKSYSQQMDRTLSEMGQKSAQEIEAYIGQLSQTSSRRIRVIMVGHSMGGIILRASLPFLSQKTKSYLHTFLSIATPHLGYLHCKNFLTETGIKLIEMMHPSISLRQLSNKDNSNVKQTFIYKLASLGSLKEFENVVVLSSIEDKYVPWNSARIQLYKEPAGVAGKNTTGGWSMNSEKHYLRFVEQEMMNHLLGIGQKDSKFRSIHRFEIDFHISQINLDTVIGRTAHVAFLANQHIMPIIFENCLRKTLHADLHA